MAQQIINTSMPNDGLGDPLRTAFIETNANFTELYANKVDKIVGKGLSSNDYDNTAVSKLAGIAENAEVNVQSDWNQNDNTQDDYIKNKPTLDIIVSIMDGIIGTTPGFAVSQQTFILPVPGSVCMNVYINGALQYKETANNGTLVNKWSQTGDIITITKTPALNNYIYIEFL